MRRILFIAVCAGTLLLCSCSPRDFLSRRLAADLISLSGGFQSKQQFQLHVGVIANKEYVSSDDLVLQHHGWITAANAVCPAALAPPPCWDITLTPSGVEAIQSLIAPGEAEKQSFNIPAARRELVAVTGIARHGNDADVEFTWKWRPVNEVGAALYPGDAHYRSTVGFRKYDDGWRVIEKSVPQPQPMDQALQNAEPVQ